MSDKKRILVVDDEKHIRDLLKQELSESGYIVREASNGKEAIDIIQSDDINIVVTDQRMPQMNGVAFLSEATQRFPGAKRALLTAYADTDAAIAAIQYTPERDEAVDFSVPYNYIFDSFLVAAGSDIVIERAADIAPYMVGVQTGTTHESWVLNNLVEPGLMSEDQLFRYERTEQGALDLARFCQRRTGWLFHQQRHSGLDDAHRDLARHGDRRHGHTAVRPHFAQHTNGYEKSKTIGHWRARRIGIIV